MQISTLFSWMRSFRMAAGRLSSPKEETPLNPEDESCARLVTLGCDGDRVERPVASRGLGRMGGRWGRGCGFEGGRFQSSSRLKLTKGMSVCDGVAPKAICKIGRCRRATM